MVANLSSAQSEKRIVGIGVRFTATEIQRIEAVRHSLASPLQPSLSAVGQLLVMTGVSVFETQMKKQQSKKTKRKRK